MPHVTIAALEQAAEGAHAPIGLTQAEANLRAERGLSNRVRPLNTTRRAFVIAMACGLGLALVLQPVRQFFDLDFPRVIVLLAATGIVTLAILFLEATERIELSAERMFRSAAL